MANQVQENAHPFTADTAPKSSSQLSRGTSRPRAAAAAQSHPFPPASPAAGGTDAPAHQRPRQLPWDSDQNPGCSFHVACDACHACHAWSWSQLAAKNALLLGLLLTCCSPAHAHPANVQTSSFASTPWRPILIGAPEFHPAPALKAAAPTFSAPGTGSVEEGFPTDQGLGALPEGAHCRLQAPPPTRSPGPGAGGSAPRTPTKDPGLGRAPWGASDRRHVLPRWPPRGPS